MLVTVARNVQPRSFVPPFVETRTLSVAGAGLPEAAQLRYQKLTSPMPLGSRGVCTKGATLGNTLFMPGSTTLETVFEFMKQVWRLNVRLSKGSVTSTLL